MEKKNKKNDISNNYNVVYNTYADNAKDYYEVLIYWYFGLYFLWKDYNLDGELHVHWTRDIS